MKAQRRRRRCLCCKELFWPDPRNRYHQRFCSKPGCRQASHQLSQQRWLAKPGNQDRWRGPTEVARVRDWRRIHPGYWKRTPVATASTLQEDCSSQPVDQKPLPAGLAPLPLQDVWRGDVATQHALVVGLISMLTASTLQEDIALTGRRLVAKGREILGMVPGTSTTNYDAKETPGSRAAAPTAQPV